MTRLPNPDYSSIRLHLINIAAFNPNVLRLIDRLLNHHGRALHNDWRRRHDRRLLYDNSARSKRIVDCATYDCAAHNAGGNTPTAVVMVVTVVMVVNRTMVMARRRTGHTKPGTHTDGNYRQDFLCIVHYNFLSAHF
jgi:hypothetical protein